MKGDDVAENGGKAENDKAEAVIDEAKAHNYRRKREAEPTCASCAPAFIELIRLFNYNYFVGILMPNLLGITG